MPRPNERLVVQGFSVRRKVFLCDLCGLTQPSKLTEFVKPFQGLKTVNLLTQGTLREPWAEEWNAYSVQMQDRPILEIREEPQGS